MSKYVIDSSTLTSIADAVRAKTGKTATIKVSDIPTEISNIEGIPDELIHYTGDCSFKFSRNSWNWVIEKYGSLITFDNVENLNGLFNYNQNIETIPFQLNFNSSIPIDSSIMFQFCSNLKEIPDINNLNSSSIYDLFWGCDMLRYLPNFVNYNFSELEYCGGVLYGCCSLRSIPQSLLQDIYTTKSTFYSNCQFYSQFYNCHTLDEIVGLNPSTGTMTDNLFYNTFNGCSRVKDIIFKTNDDGTPYTVAWKSQIIDLSYYVGYAENISNILNYNSGITADKEVTDDATYQLLKNNPDWFTTNVAYSRYNHDSAVRTINSLPDTSAYLATAGGTNTIKFKGASGASTDGGAINTLTETEIAVATAKGWTVTFA